MVRPEKVTPGPIGPATRFATTIRVGRRTTDMAVEYTTVDRPWQLASTSTMPSASIVGRLVLERVPEGTRLWWSWDVRPVGSSRLLRPVLGMVGNRQERRIWTELKHRLERDDRPASAPAREPALVYR
jgi:hypothetical protein